jgi:hypothetical protein
LEWTWSSAAYIDRRLLETATAYSVRGSFERAAHAVSGQRVTLALRANLQDKSDRPFSLQLSLQTYKCGGASFVGSMNP